jgi:hypothetical protein
MRVLRTACCTAAILALGAAWGASPAMADDCGVVVVVQVGTCQSPAAQPSPGPTHHASPTATPSPAVAAPLVPVAPAVSPAAEAIPAGSPQASTRPAAVPVPVPAPVPVAVTTAAAAAGTSPSTVPARTTSPEANEASTPPATVSGPALGGAWLLVLGGLLVAGSAVAGLMRPGRALGRT